MARIIARASLATFRILRASFVEESGIAGEFFLL